MYPFFFPSVCYCFVFLFDTVVLSQQVRYCSPLVCSCTHNKTIHVTANLLHQQIFLLLRTACDIFTTFWWLFLVSIGQKIVWVPTRNTYPFPYSYAHTEPTRIYIDVYMYQNVHELILSDMYIHVYTCVHVHTGRVSLWRLLRLDWLALNNGILRLTTWFKESFTYVNLTLMMG